MTTTTPETKSGRPAAWTRPSTIIHSMLAGLWLKGTEKGFDWCRRMAAAWELTTDHVHAQITPQMRVEGALRDTIIAWAKVAEAHRMAYGALIGEDRVLGRAWKGMGLSLLILLNGELGRLDGGTLDRLIRDIAEASGVAFEE